MSRATNVLLFILIFATTVTAATKAPLTFEITYTKEMSTAPLDGHILAADLERSES